MERPLISSSLCIRTSRNQELLSIMSDQASSPSDAIDPYKYLKITTNPDGTITRSWDDPHTSPASDPTLPISVLTKDLTINHSKKTFVRLFLPHHELDRAVTNKLPLVVCFHGGGFILFSAASTMVHDFCVNMANDAGVVIASVEYRLAPEHRLPAAYDDAIEALHWIKTCPDDWLRKYADYSSCYLMGGSAGANIAYHAGQRAAVDADLLETLKIRGLILHQPFFGGTKRTGSELRLMNDPVLPLCVTDLMWELSLPIGVDRDHEYSNPTAGDGAEKLEKMRELGWRVLVTGCDGDPLVDRQMEVVKLMEEKGLEVVGLFGEGFYHGYEVREPKKQKELIGVFKSFISSLAA